MSKNSHLRQTSASPGFSARHRSEREGAVKRRAALASLWMICATLACEGDKRPAHDDSAADSGVVDAREFQERFEECVETLEGLPSYGGQEQCGGLTTTDPVGGTLIGIAAGSFTMGSKWGWEEAIEADCVNWIPEDYSDHPYAPRHEVTLTRDFWIGQTEITVEQYAAIMGDRGWDEDGDDSFCDDCPVIVDFYEAAAFANTLSKAEGRTPCFCEYEGKVGYTFQDNYFVLDPPYDCDGYRLATEAEWEYAARAGSTDDFHSGADFVSADSSSWECGDALLSDGSSLATLGWYCGSPSELLEGDGVQAVGGLAPNAWGLYDTAGNAAEMVMDVAGYLSEEPITDPFTAEPEWVDTSRFDALTHYPAVVVRGGQEIDQALCLSSGVRQYADLLTMRQTGFRLVRTCP